MTCLTSRPTKTSKPPPPTARCASTSADENVYVTSGLADDLADGPDAVDRDQLDLAVELLRDVGEYAEDDVVEETLDADMPLGTSRRPRARSRYGEQAQRAVRRRRRAVGIAGNLPRIAAAPGVAAVGSDPAVGSAATASRLRSVLNL